MVGTRYAVSAKLDSIDVIGHGMPCPYFSEREQSQVDAVGWKQKAESRKESGERGNEKGIG